jgi:hypothetical protein
LAFRTKDFGCVEGTRHKSTPDHENVIGREGPKWFIVNALGTTPQRRRIPI